MAEQLKCSDRGGETAWSAHAFRARRFSWVVVLLAAGCCVGLLVWVSGLSASRLSNSVTPARLAAQGGRVSRIVACRELPFRTKPHFLLRDAVKEGDLVTVLCGAAPLWNPPTVPSLIHEFMLWGPEADFTGEMLGHPRSGEFIVSTLLSNEACIANTPAGGKTYLLDSPYGIRVVELGSPDSEESRGEAHFGQLLKALAEGHVSSNRAVTTSSGRVGAIADVFQDAALRFSFARELEFISCALVYWLPQGQRSWTNEYGTTISFDDVVDHLLATPFGKGACAGCHVPYAVALILQLDDSSSVLSPGRRSDATAWLEKLSWHLEAHQASYGGWDREWPGESKVRFVWGDQIMDRITVTGHHLEWMAIAPPKALPSASVVRRAVSALVNDVAALNRIPGRSFKSLLPVSHAARALILLHGGEAFPFFKEAWRNGKITKTQITIDRQHQSLPKGG